MTTIHDQAREQVALAFTYSEDGAFLSDARCLIDAAVIYLQRERETRAEMQNAGRLPKDVPPVWRKLFDAATELGMDQGNALGVFGAICADEPHADDYIGTAREQADDELEIDDTPMLSPADDGCWVAAWVWVSNSDAGIEEDDEGEEAAQEGEEGDR